MELEIRNAELTPSAVPYTPSDTRALEAFALSFDGYAHWGDRCAPLAEAAASAFESDGTLPTSLSDLRACVFHERQRWRWRARPPADSELAYMQALLDAVRSAVPGPS